MTFEVKMAKVFYEFHADGVAHRDAGRILPVVANRWRVGDTIQVLYLPDQHHDNVIVNG